MSGEEGLAQAVREISYAHLILSAPFHQRLACAWQAESTGALDVNMLAGKFILEGPESHVRF
jgi:hypothetical protein